MNVIKSNIPNSLTCLNILCGCVAVVFAFSPTDSFGAILGWQAACIAIGCAALFDFFDGFIARLTGAYSELGKQLDSLSDLVSFGVAPAMILLNLLRCSGSPAWLPWIALLLPIAAAVRLANFNIDSRQSSTFIGLPVPANAIFWIGYAAILCRGYESLAGPALALPAIIILAWLMVSPIKMFALKFKSFGWKRNEVRWIMIVTSALLLILFRLPGLALIILLYILLSLAANIFKRN